MAIRPGNPGAGSQVIRLRPSRGWGVNLAKFRGPTGQQGNEAPNSIRRRCGMTEFEFVFPLLALLIGLSVAEMLSGLSQALKSKRDVRVGWLTPLLGMLILINLAMFWQGSWEIRHGITASSASLLLILVVGAAYFLAASMVFPSWGSHVRDLDEHFMKNRTVALLAIAACNLVYFVRVAMILHGTDIWWWVGNVLFIGVLLVAALARHRQVIFAALWTLILAHGLLLVTGW